MQISRSPSWGAWIEIFSTFDHLLKIAVAPPRGERGLKSRCPQLRCRCTRVAPPRGERGLKSSGCRRTSQARRGRSPSWGAWIEIKTWRTSEKSKSSRSPSWGAWIEIIKSSGSQYIDLTVAPPRGERGLKCALRPPPPLAPPRRSPSWGAWIEIAPAAPQTS